MVQPEVVNFPWPFHLLLQMYLKMQLIDQLILIITIFFNVPGKMFEKLL